MEDNTMIKKNIPVIVWFILGIVIGAGALFVWNNYFAKNPAKIASQMEAAQVKDIVTKVGKIMMLPTGEEPVVATINDASSLIKEQPFYKGAKNGDVVLVYQKAAKAIVYSPERNVIINVGPIFLQDQQGQTTNN